MSILINLTNVINFYNQNASLYSYVTALQYYHTNMFVSCTLMKLQGMHNYYLTRLSFVFSYI